MPCTGDQAACTFQLKRFGGMRAESGPDAVGLMAERALAAGIGAEVSLSGSRAERYQVMLHVDADTLAAEGGQGRSELEDGTRVAAETSRRLACDAAMVAVKHGTDGSVLTVGRGTRTISPALRRALEARDRGCWFPSCGLRFTDVHHVRHWADGAEISLPNLPPKPVAALIKDTRSRGADPDFYTAGARWEREAQIPKQVYFRALEALG